MKQLIFACVLALAPFAAFAQEADSPNAVAAPTAAENEVAEVAAAGEETAPAPEAVTPPPIALETLTVERARRGMLQQGGSVAGLTFVSWAWEMRTNLFTQTSTRITRRFRLLGAEDAELLTGACILRTEGRTLLGVDWNQRTTQVYACRVEDQPEDQFAFEVAVPAFREGGFSFGGFSMSVQEDVPLEEQQAILQVRALYQGNAYEAAPTGFDEQRGGGFALEGTGQRRIVQGYRFTRGGAELGSITFDMDNTRDATITLPADNGVDRDAVIYMAMQLLSMPDLYSPNVRAEIQGS